MYIKIEIFVESDYYWSKYNNVIKLNVYTYLFWTNVG